MEQETHTAENNWLESLDNEWRLFRLSSGLDYEPISPKAVEHITIAMKDYTAPIQAEIDRLKKEVDRLQHVNRDLRKCEVCNEDAIITLCESCSSDRF